MPREHSCSTISDIAFLGLSLGPPVSVHARGYCCHSIAHGFSGGKVLGSCLRGYNCFTRPGLASLLGWTVWPLGARAPCRFRSLGHDRSTGPRPRLRMAMGGDIAATGMERIECLLGSFIKRYFGLYILGKSVFLRQHEINNFLFYSLVYNIQQLISFFLSQSNIPLYRCTIVCVYILCIIIE